MGIRGLLLVAGVVLALSAATLGFAFAADPPDLPPANETVEVGEPMVTMAREDVAEREDMPVETILLEKLEEALWPDTCLGVAPRDTACGQVMTPGYVITLNAEGRRFEYRSDKEGHVVLLRDATWTSGTDARIN